MNFEETYLDFKSDHLKQLVSDKSLFIVHKPRTEGQNHFTAVHYLMKIYMLFISSVANNN